MPQELLHVTPLYVFVGLYRLLTDDKLWRPIYVKSQKALKTGCMFVLIWAPISLLFFTPFYLKHFARRIQLTRHDTIFYGYSLHNYALYVSVLGQCSMILEYFVKKQLKEARSHVYEATIASRGKSADFWQKYVEEWKEPPVDRAKRSLQKDTWYRNLSTPFVRFLILRFFLVPITFIPFLTTLVIASLNSLILAKSLHKPYFDLKAMDPLQRELFVVERLFEFRSFGFTAALLERLPFVGILFSISNRIAAAMWCHDLEKTQHLYASGELKPVKVYQSKTAQLPHTEMDNTTGAFPTEKHDLKPANNASGPNLRWRDVGKVLPENSPT